MNCQEIREKGLIETYVAGTLSSEMLEEVEGHYFGCEGCARYLHECRLAHTVLSEKADRIRAERVGPVHAWPRWLPAMAMAAAILLVAFLFWPRGTVYSPTVQRAALPSYTQLAKVDPPRYEPLILRGSKEPSGDSFRAAMQSYSRGDYAAAATTLRQVVAGNREAAEPRFYLAACELLSGQSREAVDDFRDVIRLGDRQFVDQSEFLLAKAWLQQNRPEAARQQLIPLAGRPGEFASAARNLLAEINNLDAASKK